MYYISLDNMDRQRTVGKASSVFEGIVFVTSLGSMVGRMSVLLENASSRTPILSMSFDEQGYITVAYTCTGRNVLHAVNDVDMLAYEVKADAYIRGIRMEA